MESPQVSDFTHQPTTKEAPSLEPSLEVCAEGPELHELVKSQEKQSEARAAVSIETVAETSDEADVMSETQSKTPSKQGKTPKQVSKATLPPRDPFTHGDAEIMAASEAAKEAVYLKRFAEELELATSEPIELFEDNKGARDLAYNPEHHSRSKHIERRHFYIRELVESGELVVPYVKTDDNLADFFTKPLSAKRFFTLRNKIMNVPYHAMSSSSDATPASCGACGDTGIVKGEPCDLCPLGADKPRAFLGANDLYLPDVCVPSITGGCCKSVALRALAPGTRVCI